MAVLTLHLTAVQPQRWLALDLIANTPHLATHVAHLELSTAQMPDLHFPKLEYREWRDNKAYIDFPCATVPDCPKKELLQNIGSTMTRTYNNIRAFPGRRAAHGRYGSWFEDENSLARHIRQGSVPSIDIHKFPNLRCVRTVDHHHLPKAHFAYNGMPRQCSAACPSNEHCYHSRRELETSHCDAPRRHSGLQTVHTSLFMLIAEKNDFALQKLELTHFSELMASRHESAGTLTSLRHLTIRAPTGGKQILHLTAAVPPKLAQWLTILPNLHTFEVFRKRPDDAQFLYDMADIFEMLQNVCWPSLRIVRLDHVATTEDTLRHFLLEMYAHKVLPFQELVVRSPFIMPARWEVLRQELQRLSPAPRVLELTQAFQPDTDDKEGWWQVFEEMGLDAWPHH